MSGKSPLDDNRKYQFILTTTQATTGIMPLSLRVSVSVSENVQQLKWTHEDTSGKSDRWRCSTRAWVVLRSLAISALAQHEQGRLLPAEATGNLIHVRFHYISDFTIVRTLSSGSKYLFTGLILNRAAGSTTMVLPSVPLLGCIIPALRARV